MNILCILSVYNEIKFLPIKLRWMEANGLSPYFIDNISNDGTWEYLQERGVPSHRFDTGGAFDLPAIQAEIVRTIHKIKPDWVIYNGCDLFPVTGQPLNREIERIDHMGFNTASIFCISMQNTEEVMEKFDPFNTYFYYKPFIYLTMIHKYDPDIVYCADHVQISNERLVTLPGVMINYGQTKSKEEREETLQRRRKAWQNGMNPAHGSHYLEGSQRGWIWDKSELTDVRITDYYKYIKKLQEL